MPRLLESTKIVCTIGPASSKPAVIEKLIKAGMDVARLNFSHGSYNQRKTEIRTIRNKAEKCKKTTAILQDLSGPKVRIGEVENGSCVLRRNSSVILTTDKIRGTTETLSISYKNLPEEVSKRQNIFLNDGIIKLRVEKVSGKNIHCKVLIGGLVSSNKGVNLPDTDLSVPSLTPKDLKDVAFGLKNGVDMVALSFVRKPEDITRLRQVMRKNGRVVPIIAKIEKLEALKRIDKIIAVSDGIMVARGDLGIEISLEDLPLAQKKIIRRSNALGRPVITATQMLESMITNAKPTRAEVTDVANAILDGTDAVMLSGETAVGKYPVEAVRTMAKIARRLEKSLPACTNSHIIGDKEHKVADAICHAVAGMAENLKVKAIVPCTTSGSTARLIARYRPRVPIYAVSPSDDTVRQLALSWGVHPLKVRPYADSDEMVKQTITILKKNRLVKQGDKIILVAGVPVRVAGITNFIQVITV